MRFYFDIDESDFEDEYGLDFKRAVTDGAINAVADQIYNEAVDPYKCYSYINKQIEELLKSKQNELCEMVVERVADKIAKKKAIVALTPKASELAAADKDNVAYFEQMIDRAIARKFGG